MATLVRRLVQGFGRSPPVEAPLVGEHCEATLPSSTAVDRLLAGDPWAIPAVVMSTVLRAGLIGAGLFVAGYRGNELVKGGVAGALGIEVFVIGYVAICRIRDAKERLERAQRLAALHGVAVEDAPWEEAHRIVRERAEQVVLGRSDPSGRWANVDRAVRELGDVGVDRLAA